MSKPENKVSSLIDATLKYDRLRREGCFVSNLAAEELEALGAIVLPQIEAVVNDKILPVSDDLKDHNELLQKYLGLLDLWGTYFRIERNAAHIIKFLGSLRGPVLATAILALGSVWRRDDAFPEALLRFVLDASQSSNASVVLAANVCLKDVKPSVPKKSS